MRKWKRVEETRGGEVSVFGIPGQSHGWLSSMNRE